MAKLSDYFPAGLGPAQYSPAMMEFDGTSGYYSSFQSFTSAGDKVTSVARFKRATFTGGGSEIIIRAYGPTNKLRAQISLVSNNHATTGRRSKVLCFVNTSAGGTACRLISKNTFDDDQPHTVVFAYDGVAGTAVLRIDGDDEIDTGNGEHVLGTATLETGASSSFYVGSTQVPDLYWGGDIGFVGHRDAYLTNWFDFMENDGSPKELDETTWTEWGAQPLYWNQHGEMTNNLGSVGNMTENGTIIIGDGGNYNENGAPTYTPGMMLFDGTSGYYNLTSVTLAANALTAVSRFNNLNNSGTDRIIQIDNGTYIRLAVDLNSSGYIQCTCFNNTGTVICRLQSTSLMDDGNNHTCFFAYDAAGGTAILRIDGADEDDTGFGSRVLTTGTLPTGASGSAYVGRGGGTEYFNGDIGFLGYRDVYLTAWSDFMDASGNPKELDESGWTEWGAQPLFWNEHADMINNLGSAANMTKNGTIVVGKSGN